MILNACLYILNQKKNILVQMKLNFLIRSSTYNQTFTFYDFKSEIHKMDVTTFQINN